LTSDDVLGADEGDVNSNGFAYHEKLTPCGARSCNYELHATASFPQVADGTEFRTAPSVFSGIRMIVCFRKLEGRVRASVVAVNSRKSFISHCRLYLVTVDPPQSPSKVMPNTPSWSYPLIPGAPISFEYGELTNGYQESPFSVEGTSRAFTFGVALNISNVHKLQVSTDGSTSNIKWELDVFDLKSGSAFFSESFALGEREFQLEFFPNGTPDQRDSAALRVRLLTAHEALLDLHLKVVNRKPDTASVNKEITAYIEPGQSVELTGFLETQALCDYKKGYLWYGNCRLEITVSIQDPLTSIGEDSLDQSQFQATQLPATRDFFETTSSAVQVQGVCLLCQKNPSTTTLVHEIDEYRCRYRECRVVCDDCATDLQARKQAWCPSCLEGFHHISFPMGT